MKGQDEMKFDIHSLYPEDYRFDWETFEADPDNYPFTDEDMAYLNAMELERYLENASLEPDERRALWEWVASGHSPLDPPPSKYPCIHCCYPPQTFLDVYREDRELDAATEGMTDDEVGAYLKEYIGFVDESDEERRRREENEQLHRETPEKAKEKLRMLQRELSHIWSFLMDAGLYEAAQEYVDSHMEEPTPFEDDW